MNKNIKKQRARRYIIGFISVFLLIAGIFIHVSVGSSSIGITDVIKALFQPDNSKQTTVIQTLRLPRAVLAALIGASLAVAGALMQAITRNSLASPQVFGVNAGASLAIVVATILFPELHSKTTVYFAFLGSALGGITVYLFAAGGKVTHIKLALAGMAVHLFLSSLTQGVIVLNEDATDVLYWLVGSINGKNWSHVLILLPWSVFGLLAAFIMGRSISILVLGENMATGLGEKVQWIRLVSGVIVIILAGSSVAVAGPIGFIGLMVPHIARKLVGGDYQRILPFSALLGGILLIYADILSRFIAYPFESPVGIVTALIGAPFFLYLARKGRNIKQ
ncbi:MULTISPECIES: FecCD family ABC transporter permease [Priestia]|jgi:iron complex transport system permease protein|uniref:FecCD family ABC transporter permease n=1 Tax=Priestia TaxID=2800373 RepID=UPI000BFA4247|nr:MULTISPECIES: iron ABC transporter permease [Priestia]MDH2449438.1 iron ABC transporter permease [Priestia megaterium]MDL5148896.1 iron ABC transporter permease [Priestia megaterium]MDP9726077.1 iron complex transport system permease protein [Priestia aryabhattai]MED3869983.1 iron ABC transporter permease [Priestia megaterium]PER71829.1 iron-siderophore ABC transporter permease [Priestia megaterium]